VGTIVSEEHTASIIRGKVGVVRFHSGSIGGLQEMWSLDIQEGGTR
jgi:hypothetical protein